MSRPMPDRASDWARTGSVCASRTKIMSVGVRRVCSAAVGRTGLPSSPSRRSGNPNSVAFGPVDLDVQGSKHGKHVVTLHSELIAYIGQFDLPPGFRSTLLVCHDGAAMNPCVGDESSICTCREFRLRNVEVSWVALNLHHDVRIGMYHLIGVHLDQETIRDIVPHPPDEILRLVARE